MDAEARITTFTVLWIVLGVAFAAFFLLNRDAGLKRKALPPALIAVGLIFLGVMWAVGLPPETFYMAVPAVALITLLNMRLIHFCDACGRTLHSQNPFSRAKFCSKCGARLRAGT